jgi:hypothetical protein
MARSSEAQLRAARVDIDREKLITVVDHPFFISMRFKELEMRLITLEFTGDGRFAYCERSSLHMTVYEGVLMKSFGSSMYSEEDETDFQDAAGPSTEAGECAVIEGRAMVRYDRSLADEKRTVSHVERGEFRFAITVKPCFHSTEMEAWVQPLFLSMGQRQTRKHLALVDTNGNFLGEAFGNKNLPEIPSRPTSRAGMSTGLFLERAVDKSRTSRSLQSSTGLDLSRSLPSTGVLDAHVPFPSQMQRSRSSGQVKRSWHQSATSAC